MNAEQIDMIVIEGTPVPVRNVAVALNKISEGQFSLLHSTGDRREVLVQDQAGIVIGTHGTLAEALELLGQA